jgi:hypothetical protein
VEPDRCQHLKFYRAIIAHGREQTKGECGAMQQVEIHDYARQLLEARGGQAIAEAAQKATKFEMQGENEQAKTWRQIEAALKLMSGPHQK